jgi:hypothetical protein
VQLSWKMWAVTAMKKRNKFACYRVVRALWLLPGPDNAVKPGRLSHTRNALGPLSCVWQCTWQLVWDPRVRNTSSKNAKHTKKTVSWWEDITEERNAQKENDLESIKCCTSQNCKMPERERKCAVTQIQVFEVAKSLAVVCLPHMKARKG